MGFQKVQEKMAGKLSEDEVAEIKDVFKGMDVDGNGTVTSEEMRKVMSEMLPEHKGYIDVMAAMADTNGDGKIDFEEFLQMAVNGPPDGLTPEQIFKIYDKNGDGFISADDMKKLMITFGKDVSDAEVNKAIEEMKEADKDGDDKVSLEEFKAAMK